MLHVPNLIENAHTTFLGENSNLARILVNPQAHQEFLLIRDGWPIDIQALYTRISRGSKVREGVNHDLHNLVSLRCHLVECPVVKDRLEQMSQVGAVGWFAIKINSANELLKHVVVRVSIESIDISRRLVASSHAITNRALGWEPNIEI